MARIPLWIDLRHVPVNKRLPYLHAIEETAIERVLLAKEDPHHQRAGLKTAWLDGHNAIKQGKQTVGKWLKVADGKAAQRAAKVEGTIVVEATDWQIIPLENLIAARQDRPGTTYAFAKDAAQAAVFAGTLGQGVDGIVIAPRMPQEIYDTDATLRATFIPAQANPNIKDTLITVATAPAGSTTPTTVQAATNAAAERPAHVMNAPLVKPRNASLPPLVAATITALEPSGLGDRVCIDTTSLFRDGEGLLIGSTARSFALVHAETLESGFVATRPFRVNAGAVHSYLFGPDGKTRYLSELVSGAQVQAFHVDGTHRLLAIGRVKVEARPHLIVRWRTEDGIEGHAALQNAETIRLVTPRGNPVSVSSLKLGDEILVHNESAGRHTGLPIHGGIEER